MDDFLAVHPPMNEKAPPAIQGISLVSEGRHVPQLHRLRAGGFRWQPQPDLDAAANGDSTTAGRARADSSDVRIDVVNLQGLTGRDLQFDRRFDGLILQRFEVVLSSRRELGDLDACDLREVRSKLVE